MERYLKSTKSSTLCNENVIILPPMIRTVQQKDITAITEIYNYYITHSVATFDEYVWSHEQMAQKVNAVSPRYPFLVLEEQQKVIGFAYATAFKDKTAYRYTVESTIYLHPNAIGGGYGKILYQELLSNLQHQGIQKVIACITLPNPSSVALHQQLGFTAVGKFPEIGFKNNQWLDIGYWLKNL